jgi:hypothetical protein
MLVFQEASRRSLRRAPLVRRARSGVAIPMVLRLVGVEFSMTAPLAIPTSAGE